ncbi:WGR domain-containing protein [Oceanospirillum sediminis]|uniref:WGR domain-containing protein n=1 Tax=Oceanospirillum sediminis TaxID=2760088 RepID=UPI001C71EA89|nr:WGR domain-containing protein [Oceanospirillum sediminis]
MHLFSSVIFPERLSDIKALQMRVFQAQCALQPEKLYSFSVPGVIQIPRFLLQYNLKLQNVCTKSYQSAGVAQVIVRWQNEHDYCLVHIHQDMFGDWLLTKAWGQIGTQFGGVHHSLVESYDEAVTLMESIGTIQESRGMKRVLKLDDKEEAADLFSDLLRSGELPEG